MEQSSSLKLTLDSFKLASQTVSIQIKNAKTLWDDPNSVSLETGIKELSKDARQVIESGQTAIKSINHFFDIAQEPV